MGTPTVIPVWFGGVTGVSNVADLAAVKAVVGIITPTDWTPAIVTVEGSADGANFYMLYEGRNSSRISFNVPPNTLVTLRSDVLRCCKAVRLLSGDRNNLVPQVVAREFGLVVEL